MDIFKIASQEKLRFTTVKGELSTEQLWDLTIEQLDALAVSLEEEHKESGKKSFVVKKNEKDKTAKLRFDVALEVLNTKVAAAEAAAKAKEDKEHNERIFEKIAQKEDEKLDDMTIAQLKKQLR